MLKFKTKFLLLTVGAVAALMMQSCGGSRKYLVIPHSVSTVSSVNFDELHLKAGEYEILKTISESASVRCYYTGNEIRVADGDGNFTYTFGYDDKKGWNLKKFSGAAEMGYFTADYNATSPSEVPNIEEFSRRAAMAKIISAVADYHADAVVEPLVVTHVNNIGNNAIEYSTTVSAKLVVIK